MEYEITYRDWLCGLKEHELMDEIRERNKYTLHLQKCERLLVYGALKPLNQN